MCSRSRTRCHHCICIRDVSEPVSETTRQLVLASGPKCVRNEEKKHLLVYKLHTAIGGGWLRLESGPG